MNNILSQLHDVFYSDKLMSGFAVLLAWTTLDSLVRDMESTFGKSIFYHPAALWLCIVMLVYTQTESFATGFVMVALYEGFKAVWKGVRAEPPELGRLKKLLYRIQNKEVLSDSDLAFLDSITPKDVLVARK